MLLDEPLRQLLLGRSLNFCSCTTWFVDFDDSVRINRAWLYKDLKVLALQASASVAHQGACWTWNLRAWALFPLWVTSCYWIFGFHILKTKMPQLAFLCICEKLYYRNFQIFQEFFKVQSDLVWFKYHLGWNHHFHLTWKKFLTRKYSCKMCTACLTTVYVVATTRCQQRDGYRPLDVPTHLSWTYPGYTWSQCSFWGPDRMTNRRQWKHCLLATSLAGSKNLDGKFALNQ